MSTRLINYELIYFDAVSFLFLTHYVSQCVVNLHFVGFAKIWLKRFGHVTVAMVINARVLFATLQVFSAALYYINPTKY